MSVDYEKMPAGRAWVIDGEFGWKPPSSPEEDYPVLIIGGHVQVLVNGEVKSGRYQMAQGDVVQVQAEESKPVSMVEVEVSPDELSAYVQVTLSAGKRYRLRDVPPAAVVELVGQGAEELPPEPVTQDRVTQALKDAGVVFGIDPEALQAVVAQPGQRRLVAQGIPPQEPQDPYIEILFEEVERAAYDEDALRIDLLDRHRISWVEPDTLLARLIPATSGRVGRSVLGREVQPRRHPKKLALRAGSGAYLSEDGLEVRAEVSGRPVAEGNVVRVMPIFDHPGDADVSTGHIKFEGDIHIQGQVREGIQVTAGGALEVRGLVSNAKLTANLDSTLHSLLIGSEVRVGGRMSEIAALLPFVNEVSGYLEEFMKALWQLDNSAAVKESFAKGLPYGLLVKQLLESRFNGLLKLVPEIPRRLMPLSDIAGINTNVGFELVQILQGTGPLHIRSSAEVNGKYQRWRELEQEVAGYSTEPHHLTVKGIENSRVWVSGNLIITGFGSYNSKIEAGGDVIASRGVMRGGQISSAQGSVEFKELGSKSGVTTVISVGGKGQVKALVVHPGVILSIGGERRIIREFTRNLRARLDSEGQLQVLIGRVG